MKKTIYIAGKITGMEHVASFLFAEAELKLKAKGYEVVNPMKLPHNHNKKWISYMRECHRAMSHCDGIYFLDNWEESNGAKDEFIHALQLHLLFLNQPTSIGVHTYRHFRDSLISGKINLNFSMRNALLLLSSGVVLGAILTNLIFTIFK